MAYLIDFLLFLVLQSLVINGIFECFQGGCVNDLTKGKVCSGNIFYLISPSFFEKHRGKKWTMPLWGCVRCMASVHGTITFWLAIYLFVGFDYREVFVWVGDVFALVFLNYYLYKKL